MALDESTTFTHPSYGIVSFSRTQNGGRGHRLFGSALANHAHSVRMTLSHCERRTSHGMDRFYAESQIITVELSAAQFAELITSMNVGDGVPCTIIRHGGKVVEPPPDVLTPIEHAKVDFADRMKTFAESLASTKVAVEKATEGATLTKVGREAIRSGVAKIVQEVGENIPYFISLYQEAAEKVGAAAKAEYDAWLTAAIQRAGLQSLIGALSTGKGDEVLALTESSAIETKGTES